MGLTRLVECDVPVLADPTEEELDAAVLLYLRFVRIALGDEVGRVPVEDVYLLRGDIDCRASASATRSAGKGRDAGVGGRRRDALWEKNSRNMKVW